LLEVVRDNCTPIAEVEAATGTTYLQAFLEFDRSLNSEEARRLARYFNVEEEVFDG
jgi:hypothetical protein